MMKTKMLWVLLIALVWSGASWWWYTCNIKGFCDAAQQKLAKHDRLDSDQDGLINGIETSLGLNFKHIDSDLDGIHDQYEIHDPKQPQDTDDDGIIDALDADDDGDNIASSEEFSDNNGNGSPDDALDSDQDGIPDYLDAVSDLDTDNDGLSDVQEMALGLDPAALDSDQDGIYDAFEVGDNPLNPLDSDQDGTINALDNDDDNDTLITKHEKADINNDGNPSDAIDTDGDGQANYLDLDSDNDGLSDKDEVNLGLSPLLKDSDNDGLSDQVEVGEDVTAPLDQDGDGVIDALDVENKPIGLADAVADSITKNDQVNPKEEGANSKQNRESDQMTISLERDESEIGTNESGSVSPIVKAIIRFPYNSTAPQLSEEVEQYFTAVAAILLDQPARRIRLVGHTDNIGSEQANLTLGLERARVIEKILLNKGVAAQQLDVRSEGERMPIADNASTAGQQINRRVELLP